MCRGISVYTQIIRLTQRLNRAGQSLTDEETDWLMEAIRLESTTRTRERSGPVKPWQRNDIKKLRSLLKTHKVPAAAVALGRSRNSVYKKAQKLGISLAVDA